MWSHRMTRTLSADQARAYYERHAPLQDRQGWYEDAALGQLLASGDFGRARRVLEIGCGTGRAALALGARHRQAAPLYVGLDMAWAMLELTRPRLAGLAGASGLLQADATRGLPFLDAAFDRVIVAYLLDLLSEREAHRLVAEAGRVLRPRGLLCLASLTRAPAGLAPRLMALGWTLLQRLSPRAVGGCRPITLGRLLDDRAWKLRADSIVAPRGLASQIIVAEKL